MDKSLMLKKADKMMPIFELIFKIEFLLFGFAGTNCFIFGGSFMSVFVDLAVVFAGVVLVYRLINFKRYIGSKYLLLFVLFCASYVISMLLNYKYGNLVQGVKTLVWMGIQYCLIYAYDTGSSIQSRKKEFDITAAVYSVYMFFASLVSLALLFTKYSKTVKHPSGITSLRGLIWGRLWGVFTDPNYGSVMAVVAIILSFYFILNYKKLYVKMLCIANMSLQLLYISFSDSRTGLVSLFATLLLSLYLFLSNYYEIFKSKKLLNKAVPALIALVASVSFLFIPSMIKDGYNDVLKSQYNNYLNSIGISIGGSISIGSSGGQKDNIKEPPELLGREQDIENDISNRRFALWQSGAEIFATSPIYGTSFDSLDSYTLKNLPQTYLVKNSTGAIFGNFHNVVVNIAVSQGAIGIVILVAIMFFFAKYVISNIFKYKNKEEISYTYTLLLIIACIGCSSMFVSEIFYNPSANTMIFWICVSHVVHYIDQRKGGKTENA